MTAAQLQTRLAQLLAQQLGTYTRGSVTRPAITVGEPESDWTASGLEVRIEGLPEYNNRDLHGGTVLGPELVVRFTPHPGTTATNVRTAVERVMTALNTTNPTTVPQNERLGIRMQYTLRVRSL